MKAKYLTITACLSFLFLISHAKEFNKSVHFESGSFELSHSNQKILDQWLEEFNLLHLDEISIIGHTDSDGSTEYNSKLSAQRAKSVYKYLLTKEIANDQLLLSNYGETKPLESNTSDNGKLSNRRVELVASVSQPRFSALNHEIDVETQLFKANADEQIRIKGKGGTIIDIPANALVTKSGSPAKGKIKFTLKEYLTSSDFLMGQLHTQSGDKLLESGGTILLEAYDGSRKLHLREGDSMRVYFASRTQDDRMQLFNGVEDHGDLDWHLSESGDFFSDSKTRRRGWSLTWKWWNLRSVPGNIGFINSIDNRLFDIIPNPSPIDDITTDSATLAQLQAEYKIQQMMMSSAELGWINCDRFNEEPKALISAMIDTSYHASVFLVFSDINSVMAANGYLNHGKEARFSGAPRGRKATFFATSVIDDVPYYAMQEVEIGSDRKVPMSMQQTSMNELKSIMKGLD